MKALDVTLREVVEKLEARWWGPNPAVGIANKWRGAEPIIHDLCHAAVMIRSTKPPRKKLASRIGLLFDRFENSHASDMSEIRALAVEEAVLRRLEASPRVFRAVFRSGAGSSNLRVMPYKKAKEAFHRVKREKAVPRRAALVLRWLREAIEATS